MADIFGDLTGALDIGNLDVGNITDFGGSIVNKFDEISKDYVETREKKIQDGSDAIIDQGKDLIDQGMNPFDSLFDGIGNALAIGGIVIVCALIGYMIYRMLSK